MPMAAKGSKVMGSPYLLSALPGGEDGAHRAAMEGEVGAAARSESPTAAIPAQAGIQSNRTPLALDTRFRGYDGQTFNAKRSASSRSPGAPKRGHGAKGPYSAIRPEGTCGARSRYIRRPRSDDAIQPVLRKRRSTL